jgi:hypothetical protein
MAEKERVMERRRKRLRSLATIGNMVNPNECPEGPLEPLKYSRRFGYGYVQRTKRR